MKSDSLNFSRPPIRRGLRYPYDLVTATYQTIPYLAPMAALDNTGPVEKHPGGRPPLFDTPEKLKLACDEFISSNPGKLTITGLAMWLGFCDRQSLYDYEKRPEFSCIIKEARLAVENDYELSLRSPSVTGAIFALKNMGWKDKTETDMNVKSDRPIQVILPPNE